MNGGTPAVATAISYAYMEYGVRIYMRMPRLPCQDSACNIGNPRSCHVNRRFAAVRQTCAQCHQQYMNSIYYHVSYLDVYQDIPSNVPIYNFIISGAWPLSQGRFNPPPQKKKEAKIVHFTPYYYLNKHILTFYYTLRHSGPKRAALDSVVLWVGNERVVPLFWC